MILWIITIREPFEYWAMSLYRIVLLLTPGRHELAKKTAGSNGKKCRPPEELERTVLKNLKQIHIEALFAHRS